MPDLVDYLRDKLNACSCVRGTLDGLAGRRAYGVITRWTEGCPVHADDEEPRTELQRIFEWLQSPTAAEQKRWDRRWWRR